MMLSSAAGVREKAKTVEPVNYPCHNGAATRRVCLGKNERSELKARASPFVVPIVRCAISR